MVSFVMITSIVISITLLVAAGIKWELEVKVVLPASILIGLVTGAIIVGINCLLSLRYFQSILAEMVVISVLSSTGLLLRFFRDPERQAPGREDIIVSPADGKVIYIKMIEESQIPLSEKGGKKIGLEVLTQSAIQLRSGYLIGIAMNYLDVHVNRAPIDGVVTILNHVNGLFLSLKRREAVIENERVYMAIDNGKLKVGIVQIASRLVRKIVPYIRQGQVVRKGDRIGMIRFGSQVDIIIPDEIVESIEVKMNERVVAGISIIARVVQEAAASEVGASNEEMQT